MHIGSGHTLKPFSASLEDYSFMFVARLAQFVGTRSYLDYADNDIPGGMKGKI